MAENEDGPEHGSLEEPIERPEGPAIEVDGADRERGDDDGVAEDIAHRSPWIPHPTMARNGDPDVADPERRRLPGVEVTARRDPLRFALLGHAVHRLGGPAPDAEGGGDGACRGGGVQDPVGCRGDGEERIGGGAPTGEGI